MAPVVRIPTLQEIASSRVAVALWESIDLPSILWLNFNKEDADSPFISFVLKSLNKLNVPPRIAKLLETQVENVKKELDIWVRHFTNEIFRSPELKYELYGNIGDIIWYADGTINRKATARNLLNSLRLSEIDKYHILCHYSLKDDIDRLSPLLFTKNIVDHVEFSDDPSNYYWNCYFRNELDKVPVDDEENSSLDVFMFQHDEVDWWSMKEHFFDRLNAQEQVENIIWLIDDGSAFPYLKLLLMKLTENQLFQGYTNRAVAVIKQFLHNDNGNQEILPTWYDVRDLITQEEFVTMFTNLLEWKEYVWAPVPGAILSEIWISAGDDFRSHILNQGHVVFEKTLKWFKRAEDESFMSTLLQYTNENLKQEIIVGRFFRKFCKKLINKAKLNKLESLFIIWSSSGDDYLVQFKRDFTQTAFFVNFCDLVLKETVYADEEDDLVKVKALEQLWNILFSTAEEVTAFKKDFTQKELFRDACRKMLSYEKFYSLESLFNLCLVDDGEFERDFVKNENVFKYCRELIERTPVQLLELEQLMKACSGNIDVLTEFQNKLINQRFFVRKCEELIEHKDFSFLENLFDICVPNTSDATIFKKDLITRAIRNEWWESAKDVNQLLKLCLPDHKSPESVQFMRDLVFDSGALIFHCLWCYGWKCSTTNDLLMELLLSRSDIVLEYKKQLWMSPSGVRQAVRFLSRERGNEITTVLNEIIAYAFPDDTDSANEFKKKVIFSNEFMEELQKMIFGGDPLNLAKKRIEIFLPSIEDQQTLKKQLIDNLQPKMSEMFHKNGHSGWQSLMERFLENNEAVLALKYKLPIDEFFEREFKECIFQTYDEHHRVSRCTLKKNFVFDSLDVLLNWYFESPKERKEYKVGKLDAYENMKPIDTLLKKNCHSSYMTKLMDWFFENDAVQMAEFKKKHKGEHFVNMIRICRDSYFKNRRTL
ncbi:uncharacterized protein LOC135835044 [Planococcus citri]|uniref:uncharacterized protein LOC135835044 n=1 Tax=Planococcus citri TaxID=170843 RepID=UPI0031F798F4